MAKKKPARTNKRAQERDNDRKVTKAINNGRSDVDRTNLQKGSQLPQDGNDPEWWSHSPQMLRDAASIPFSSVLGVRTKFGRSYNATSAGSTFPGICGLQVRPVPGDQEEPDSPINVCARNLMADIRAHISGTRPYDAPNIMMYLLGIGSLYGVFAHCARMYGLMQTYAVRNRYYPKAFFDVIGWDYEDFARNQANFRLWLNTLAEKIGSLCYPADLDFTKRQMWMYSNIFLDGASTKAQTYFFYPEGALKYKYDAENAEYPIQLELVPLGPDSTKAATGDNAYWKVSDLMNCVDVIVQSLVEKEDIATMSGDFLKTFTPSGLWVLNPIPEGFIIEPQLNDYALQQIHNSILVPKDLLGVGLAGGTTVIAEYADTVNKRTWLKTFCRGTYNEAAAAAAKWRKLLTLFGSYTDTDGNVSQGQIMLNSYKEFPDEHDIIEMTRCIPAILYNEVLESAKLKGDFRVRAATEVITGMAVVVPAFTTSAVGSNVLQFASNTAQSGSLYTLKAWNNYGSIGADAGTFVDSVLALACIFDWFPHQYEVSVTGSTSPGGRASVQNIYSQVENYTFTTEEIMRNMHYVAQLSIYSIPPAARTRV